MRPIYKVHVWNGPGSSHVPLPDKAEALNDMLFDWERHECVRDVCWPTYLSNKAEIPEKISFFPECPEDVTLPSRLLEASRSSKNNIRQSSQPFLAEGPRQIVGPPPQINEKENKKTKRKQNLTGFHHIPKSEAKRVDYPFCFNKTRITLLCQQKLWQRLFMEPEGGGRRCEKRWETDSRTDEEKRWFPWLTSFSPLSRVCLLTWNHIFS